MTHMPSFFAKRLQGVPYRVATSAGLLATLLLAACNGGTGTDTDNGAEPLFLNAVVLNADGSPAPEILLSVHRPAYRADSVEAPPLLTPDDSIVSDANGSFQIALKYQGVYILQGRRRDTTVLLDTLKALEPGGVLYSGFGGPPTFRIQEPTRANGTLALRSGYKTDSGRVILRGTTHLSEIGADGAYDFGELPPAAERLAVSVLHNAVPAGHRYIRVVETQNGYMVQTSAGTACSAEPDTPAEGYLPASTDRAGLAAHAIRLAGSACTEQAGMLVNVRLTDSAGVLLESLGNYVIPRPGVLTGGVGAVREECLIPGTEPTPRGVLDLASKRILVEDVRRGPDCAN